MKLSNFLLLEAQGLASTINEYTRNHYIRNYTSLLVEFSNNEELDKLLLVIKKLIEWYDVEIFRMRNNDFIYNLEVHEKSYILLKEVEKSIENKYN